MAYNKIAAVGVVGMVGCVFLAAQSIAIYCALLLTRVSNVALLINTSPCFCALGDIYWLGETVPKRTVAMIVVGLISVAVIIGRSNAAEFCRAECMGVGGDVAAESSHRVIIGNCVAMINPISWAIFWAISRQHALQAETSSKHTADESTDDAQVEDKNQLKAHSDASVEGQKWDRMLVFQLVESRTSTESFRR